MKKSVSEEMRRVFLIPADTLDWEEFGSISKGIEAKSGHDDDRIGLYGIPHIKPARGVIVTGSEMTKNIFAGMGITGIRISQVSA